jgi:hypothetical protein
MFFDDIIMYEKYIFFIRFHWKLPTSQIWEHVLFRIEQDFLNNKG